MLLHELSPWRTASRGTGRNVGLFAFNVDNEMAARAFVLALGMKVFFIAQGQVDHAAFARRHGSETVSHAGLADFFGGGCGRVAEFLQTQRAVVLTIEGNFFVVPVREMKDLEREQFEGAEQLGVA